MYRLLVILFSFLLLNQISGQCPDLSTATSTTNCDSGDCAACGNENIVITTSDPNLPPGFIDWYTGDSPGFDPLTQGTLLGSSNISAAQPCDNCPTIEAIHIDACASPESLNEFFIIGSGSGFAVDDLSFSFDDANTSGGGVNSNVGAGNTCGWFDGDVTLFSGCNNLISVGPGDYIPRNSVVIVSASRLGSVTYDVSSLCGISECVYVLSNACDRTIGGFSNCGAGTGNGSDRINILSLTCGCSDMLTYDILDPAMLAACAPNGDGTYVLKGQTYGNDGCDNGPPVTSIPQNNQGAVVANFAFNFDDTQCNTTQYVVGILNSDQYNEECCGPQVSEEYAFDVSCPEATLTGGGDLCPGDCVEIEVEFIGGESPYSLNLTFDTNFPLIPDITIPFGAFPAGAKVTICYDTGGPVVDEANLTVNVPPIPLIDNFDGSLFIDDFTDANGCMGTINGGSVSISFNSAPDIITPPTQEACDLGVGSGLFILTDIADIINGGSGENVNFYLDAGGSGSPLTSPFITPDITIYAQIEGDPCDSEIVPVDLVVIENGDAGVISMYCDPITPSTECTICDDDAISGEEIELTIFFENTSSTYDFEVVWTADTGPSSTIIGTGTGGTATFTFNIFTTTTFELTTVTENDECPDTEQLGQVVTVHYSLLPMMDQPEDLEECGSVTLPQISGTVIPDNAAYFSEPNGQGTMYEEGDEISSTQIIYLFGGTPECNQELQFEVTILDEAVIDEPMDIISCGTYSLPEITGTNVENAQYYTQVNGTGSILPVGFTISNSIILYLFDPVCGGNQPDLEIIITPGPIIENNPDTLVCEMYIVENIIGQDLTGTQAYFDESMGLGNQINIGDTITTDSIIYIFDDTGGCAVEIAVNIDIHDPYSPGGDSTITLCQGDPTLINLNSNLAGNSQEMNGSWSEISTSGINIDDSTSVDFSTQPEGLYEFLYTVLDSICFDTSALLSVNILGTIDAGNDAILTSCDAEVTINVISLLNDPAQGGVFISENDITPSGDLTNLTLFNNDFPGTTDFYYILGDQSSSCGADTAILTITFGAAQNAGEDASSVLCAGASVDLSTLLSGNNGVGIFEEETPTGNLTGNQFNSGGLSDGDYPIYHILDTSAECPSDTALITISVSQAADAGSDNVQVLCGGDMISLPTLIDGDTGGDFFEGGILLSNTTIDLSGVSGTLEYLYVVGDGQACPFDSAMVSLTVQGGIQAGLDGVVTSICDDGCATLNFDFVSDDGIDGIVYYTIVGTDGFIDMRTMPITTGTSLIESPCVGTDPSGQDFMASGNSYTYTMDSILINDCVYPIDENITITVNEMSTFQMTGSYCTDDVVIVGPDQYDVNTPIGITTIINGNTEGCDSTINVNLTFQDFAIGEINETLCSGDSILIFDNYYFESYIPIDTLIDNGSVNGCDSLITIDVTFETQLMGMINTSICSGDTVFVVDQVFTTTTVDEIVNTFSLSGCDSMIIVNIDIDEPAIGSFTQSACENYSIIINGTTYDFNNPSGSETLPNQASNGCDSLIQVDISFDQSAIDSLISFSTCDVNEFIIVGGELFFIDNPSGMVTLSASSNEECDTSVTIDIIFGELGIDYLSVPPGCEARDSGIVRIDDILGTSPFSIFYNGNNTIAFELPIDIPLPIGSGELMILDASGCEILVPYDLIAGGNQVFNINQNINQLSISGGSPDSVLWSPSDGLSCTNCIDPIATPEITTEYIASIYYGDSCLVMDTLIFEVIDNVPDYIVPNIFSPNGDNQNDNFSVILTDGAIGEPILMSIFDRWGNKVFHSNQSEEILNQGWNGRRNNDDLTPGVYVYIIQILEPSGNVINLYGDVLLMR